MKIRVLGSSSDGNSTFIAGGSARVLVDAGLSRKCIVERLTEMGERLDTVDAVLLTHEHTDHVSGLQVLMRHFTRIGRRVPIYCTAGTEGGLGSDIAALTPDIRRIVPGEAFAVGELQVLPFAVAHDGAEPVGFRFTADGVVFGFATDLGCIDEPVAAALSGCQVLMLEANHDIDMLRVGPYSWALKQRVMGKLGHLSNEVACDHLRVSCGGSAAPLHVVFGHLSQNNNMPDLVRLVAGRYMADAGIHPALQVLEPGEASSVIQI